MGLVDRRKAQVGVVPVALQAECFDDELMVVSLWEARDGDRSDNTGAHERDGKGSAMACVVGDGQPVLFLQGGIARVEREANGVRTAMKPRDQIRLPSSPLGVSGDVPRSAA
jgi:hypothetical protein